ncbi:MAG: tetratricopeptide repeat protein [Sulfuricellaceae bacterium]
MLNWKLGLGALSLESSALLAVYPNQTGAGALALFLLCHGGASVMLALFVHGLLPPQYRLPRLLTLALLFSFAFFMPVVGLASLWLSVVASTYLPRFIKQHEYAKVELPEFVPARGGQEMSFGHGALRPMLTNRSIPVERRMKALLALQGVAPSAANPILRQSMDDTADDIRLIAYGIIDRREKAIYKKIRAEAAQLEQAQKPEERLNSLRHLAELHWELVYEHLVQGDVKSHLIAEARRYVDEAQKLAPDDPGIWYLRGRAELETGNLQEAEFAFMQSFEKGLPRARVLPYLAEVTFRRRDFELVAVLLKGISEVQLSPRLKPVVSYWTSRGSKA